MISEKRNLNLKKYQIYVLAGIILFFIFVMHGTMVFLRASANFPIGTEKIFADAVFYPFLELTIGIVILIVSVHFMYKARYEDTFLENQKVRAIIDSGYSLIFDYSVKGSNIKWYGDAEKVFNVVGSNISIEKIIHPDDWPIALQQIEDVKRDKVYSSGVRFVSASGEYLLCSCRMVALKSMSGKTRQILGVIQDMDGQIKCEKELNGKVNTFADAINLISDFYSKIMLLDLNTGTCRCVRADINEFCMMDAVVDRDRNLVDYSKWHKYISNKLIHPDNREKFTYKLGIDALRQCIAEGQNTQTVNYLCRTTNDKEYRRVQAECISYRHSEEEDLVMIYIREF